MQPNDFRVLSWEIKESKTPSHVLSWEIKESKTSSHAKLDSAVLRLAYGCAV